MVLLVDGGAKATRKADAARRSPSYEPHQILICGLYVKVRPRAVEDEGSNLAISPFFPSFANERNKARLISSILDMKRWTTPEQHAWLVERYEGFIQAQKDGDIQAWLSVTTHTFLTVFLRRVARDGLGEDAQEDEGGCYEGQARNKESGELRIE